MHKSIDTDNVPHLSTAITNNGLLIAYIRCCDKNVYFLQNTCSNDVLIYSILFQVDQAFAVAPIDVAGNIDYKSLCYIITHGDEKEES